MLLTKAVRRVKLPAMETVSGVQYLSGEPVSKHLRLRCLPRGATCKIERLKFVRWVKLQKRKVSRTAPFFKVAA